MSEKYIPISKADLRIIDGKPYSNQYQETYSCTAGIAEAQHVFIEGNRLTERWQTIAAHESSCFVIGETGFGTGLNFVLAWKQWQQYAPGSARLYYISCEQHPLSAEDLKQCFRVWPELEFEANALLSAYPVLTPGIHTLSFAEGRITLLLMLGDALKCYRELLHCGDVTLEQKMRSYWVDAWFLDGFSPKRNPSMWSRELFSVLGMLSRKGTTFSAFTIASLVRKGLSEAGFKYQIAKGNEHECSMLFGNFDHITNMRCGRSTPWHIHRIPEVSTKTALVIGAGLAGCYTAHALAQRGWSVKLIDSNDKPARGASGNRQAILYPKLSNYQSPLTEYMLYAFLYAVRAYQSILKNHPDIGALTGILQLAYNSRELNSQKKLEAWILAYPELGKLVDQQQASMLAGIKMNNQGLFIPKSGWLDLVQLSEHLSQLSNIEWIPNRTISEIKYQQGSWYADTHSAEVLVIASGHELNRFQQTRSLPYKSIRGQMTAVAENYNSKHLKLPLCADVHVLPEQYGQHWVGATYCPGEMNISCTDSDDQLNLTKLREISENNVWESSVVNHWAGIRGAAPDYLPLVGPIADEILFKQRFSGLERDGKRWIPSAGIFYPNLYLCAGFGSRGLTTIPLSAEWLAGLINHEPSILPHHLIQAISPARFLYRDIIRKGKEIS